ncbi:unnamed protein product [Durusdinium trenchii]|uniref:Uncharacterized protein n=1 Tax=Durusdinium trenchii TaxID=1381693 RepID=A0ABP0RT22_9DINO
MTAMAFARLGVRLHAPRAPKRWARCFSVQVDPQYPGTALERLQGIHFRVKTLSTEELSGEWQEVRRRLLWAGGLRDLPDVPPGRGCTAHSFNDDTHCDLTAMLGDVAHNQNDGNIQGIATGNLLGPGIQVASLPELGPGGSWSTCMNGCHLEPPQDVAHVQFRSRVAFKLVWCPPAFKKFVLVDDDGNYLAHGEPSGELPHEIWRKSNYELVKGGRILELVLVVTLKLVWLLPLRSVSYSRKLSCSRICSRSRKLWQ